MFVAPLLRSWGLLQAGRQDPQDEAWDIDNIENFGDWELMLSMLYTEVFCSIKKCLSTWQQG